MYCHYTHDKDGSKHHIPGCWGGAINGPDGCTCDRSPKTFAGFEKKRFDTTVKTLTEENNHLKKEVVRLNRILNKLYDKRANRNMH